jgi:uracil-DNA glycosylase family 4
VVADPTPELAACRACPRLASNLDRLRREEPSWHNAPVRWCGDPDGRLMVVGLAPGRTGANRTGTPFCGDPSGDWLWEALHREGFAATASAREALPVLRDAMITNAVKCLPPGNRPLGTEIHSCRAHLAAEVAAFGRVRVVVALGRVAHQAWLSAAGVARSAYPFQHGAVHKVGSQSLVDSFHPSPLNTRTGRLSARSWQSVWRKAARLAREEWHVYLLRCGDSTLYTGITSDLLRREKQHNSRKGARYTRSHRGGEILWSEPAPSRGAALSREYAIKQLSRAQKFALAGVAAESKGR